MWITGALALEELPLAEPLLAEAARKEGEDDDEEGKDGDDAGAEAEGTPEGKASACGATQSGSKSELPLLVVLDSLSETAPSEWARSKASRVVETSGCSVSGAKVQPMKESMLKSVDDGSCASTKGIVETAKFAAGESLLGAAAEDVTVASIADRSSLRVGIGCPALQSGPWLRMLDACPISPMKRFSRGEKRSSVPYSLILEQRVRCKRGV